MPFSHHDLSVVGYAFGLSLYIYKPVDDDTLDVICAPNYFDIGHSRLNSRDLIMISAIDGARIVVVTSIDRETVVIAKLS